VEVVEFRITLAEGLVVLRDLQVLVLEAGLAMMTRVNLLMHLMPSLLSSRQVAPPETSLRRLALMLQVELVAVVLERSSEEVAVADLPLKLVALVVVVVPMECLASKLMVVVVVVLMECLALKLQEVLEGLPSKQVVREALVVAVVLMASWLMAVVVVLMELEDLAPWASQVTRFLHSKPSSFVSLRFDQQVTSPPAQQLLEQQAEE
jgi:hypothetical protein